MVFKKGETTNPDGNNGHLKGYQRYADRAVFLQEKYTVGEIIDMVADAKKLRALPVRDAQIIKHLANTLMGDDMRLERESLLDRIEGKPKELKEVKGDMSIKVEIVRFSADNPPASE
jgi:hypothetical protein